MWTLCCGEFSNLMNWHNFYDSNIKKRPLEVGILKTIVAYSILIQIANIKSNTHVAMKKIQKQD